MVEDPYTPEEISRIAEIAYQHGLAAFAFAKRVDPNVDLETIRRLQKLIEAEVVDAQLNGTYELLYGEENNSLR